MNPTGLHALMQRVHKNAAVAAFAKKLARIVSGDQLK
jgi:hypothetical protein